MKTINLNLVASRGIAMGSAFIPKTPNLLPISTPILQQDIDNAITIFNEARDLAILQLIEIAEKMPKQKDIFTAHINLLKSGSLTSGVVDLIKNDLKNPQMALKETENTLKSRFEAMEDSYMKERAADISDICNRIMANLKNVSLNIYDNIKKPTIIIAKDLLPSDTSQMDFNNVLGFITEIGGATSHTSIIAKNIGIPAAVGQVSILQDVTQEDFLIFDGDNSILYINPSQNLIDDYKSKQKVLLQQREDLKRDATLPTITKDGREIGVWANVGSITDIKNALHNGADGIGLFRTEFLYMESRAFPTEEDQYEIYKEAALLCGEKPLIVRTLDIGGDKSLPYFNFPVEENPFLGWRAIRMTLDEENIFKAQLRALLRASAHGNIQIMYPFIISLEEFHKANNLLKACMKQLKENGIAYNKNIQTGIMIETPASVILVEDFAKEVDFFSIGTNDLTQYILAVDRGNDKIANLYDNYHPAVLIAINQVINAGNKYNKPVGMCGEFASDKNATELLLGMGLDKFSMSPSEIPSIKHSLRNLNYTEAKNKNLFN